MLDATRSSFPVSNQKRYPKQQKHIRARSRPQELETKLPLRRRRLFSIPSPKNCYARSRIKALGPDSARDSDLSQARIKNSLSIITSQSIEAVTARQWR